MLLTISIPTYNRASHLDFLLSVLEAQLKGLEESVAVFVSDNASTDQTPEVTAKYAARIANFVVRRNATNLGSDWNIREAYQAPDSEYVWIMGDDDAPIRDSMPLLVNALKAKSPDILYVPGIGRPDIAAAYPNWCARNCSAVELDRQQFAGSVNAMFMFISSFILRKDTISTSVLQAALEITNQTCLTQLAWVYETLNHGQRFVHMRDGLLLSTNGANSGYGVLDVLLVNQARLVERLLYRHPDVQKAILFRANLNFFPWLIWFMRKNKLGTFKIQERSTLDVPRTLADMLSFRLLVTPIWTLPKGVAGLFYQAARVLARMAREYDRRIAFR